MKKFSEFKKYLFSLASLFWLSFFIFSFGIILGYVFARDNPQKAQGFLKSISEALGPIQEAGPFEMFLFIFLNNAVKILLAIFLGIIFGIFPAFFLLANGEILGILAFFSLKTGMIDKFFLGILPHGVIEIPVLLLGSALGMKLGRKFFARLFKKEQGLKQELGLAFRFFTVFILPILFLAALIEVFLTAKILGTV